MVIRFVFKPQQRLLFPLRRLLLLRLKGNKFTLALSVSSSPTRLSTFPHSHNTVSLSLSVFLSRSVYLVYLSETEHHCATGELCHGTPAAPWPQHLCRLSLSPILRHGNRFLFGRNSSQGRNQLHEMAEGPNRPATSQRTRILAADLPVALWSLLPLPASPRGNPTWQKHTARILP
ncbi:hypothetical protein KFK09_009015 [Dendrobium nobile]|uniref:Uncharacterized protein n=1 Tax=Dendrobium nobile TaxID=94219 RepID=A0A8T3BSG2_DENNO|nr:hypothetical protein KFK09_009015 [Dendrobium nobile]